MLGGDACFAATKDGCSDFVPEFVEFVHGTNIIRNQELNVSVFLIPDMYFIGRGSLLWV